MGGVAKFDTIRMQKTNLQFRMHQTIIDNLMVVALIIYYLYQCYFLEGKE